MKIAACCCTFRRPETLAELIDCFERQTLPQQQRELIILDDLGQYLPQSGPGWRIVSFRGPFSSLGQKRNACLALADPDCELIAIADDDDLYLPWWLETIAAAACRQSEVSWWRPRETYHEGRHGWSLVETFDRRNSDYIGYQGGWAFRRHVLEETPWPCADNGEDKQLAPLLQEQYGRSACPLHYAPGYRPFYCFRGGATPWHTSCLSPARLAGMREATAEFVGAVPRRSAPLPSVEELPTEVRPRPW